MENEKNKSELIEELEKGAKKKKINVKRRRIIIVCILCLIAIGYGLFLWKAGHEETQTEVTIAAGDGEELLYVTVGSIVGNELTGTLSDSPEEAYTCQIPVGTPVITRLGMETTFSRISAGNNIAVLLEDGTDNILKIWIVQ